MVEQSRARNILFRELMSVPHRDYTPMVQALREALEDDPDFIARACVYLNQGGSKIRDQQDSAVITLLQAPHTFSEYREAGRCVMLGGEIYNMQPDGFAGLPPFRVFRIAKYIAKSNHKVPRLMKSIIADYLDALEKDIGRFDGVAVRNRKALKNAYKRYHIAPSARAQRILFDNNPPRGSKFAVLKQIANSTDAKEQAKLIIKNKIPYPVAASVMPKMNVIVGVALIDIMSPTEALNSRAWVEQSGLLNIPEVRTAYIDKVSKATASVASAEHRKSAKGQDAEVETAISKAKQKATDKATRIEMDTLIMVDRSSSMERAIELAQEFGYRIAPIVDGDLMVVTFNDYAQEITVDDKNSLASWQTAFKAIRASGWTSMVSGLELAIKRGFEPQAIILITDGGENRGDFANMVQNQLDFEPRIVQITVQGRSNGINHLRPKIEQAGLPHYEHFEYTGDYYIFDQVIALLGGPPAKSIVEKILETQLPRRI